MITFLNTVTNRDWQWKMKATDPAQPCMVQWTALVLRPTGEFTAFGGTYAMDDGETLSLASADRLRVTSPQVFLDADIPRLDLTAAMDLQAILGSSTLLVAHSAAFHRKVCESVLFRHGIDAPITADWFCTMLEATDICQIPPPRGYGKSKWPTLDEAWRHFSPTSDEISVPQGDASMGLLTLAGLVTPAQVRDVYAGILRHRGAALPPGLAA